MRSERSGRQEGRYSRSRDKIKCDHQIVAAAKVEGVSEIIAMDRDIHQHGKLWGISVRNVSELPVPHIQGKLPLKDPSNDDTKRNNASQEPDKRTTNSKPIPHIPLPFKEVMADVLKVKPPEKQKGHPTRKGNRKHRDGKS
jgi:hypothetical protein